MAIRLHLRRARRQLYALLRAGILRDRPDRGVSGVRRIGGGVCRQRENPFLLVHYSVRRQLGHARRQTSLAGAEGFDARNNVCYVAAQLWAATATDAISCQNKSPRPPQSRRLRSEPGRARRKAFSPTSALGSSPAPPMTTLPAFPLIR